MQCFYPLTITLVTILIFSSSSHATIRRVPTAYSTITAAVQASNPNDTVLLAVGRYTERVFVTNQSLTIAGAYLFSRDTNDIPQVEWTILDSIRADSTTPRSMLRIHNSARIRVVGILFQGGLGTLFRLPQQTRSLRYGGAIFADSSNLIIEHCRITNSTAFYGGGIAISSGNFMFSNSTVNLCYVTGYCSSGGGINVLRCDSVLIRKVSVLGNASEYFNGGLTLSAHVYGELIDSFFSENYSTNGNGGCVANNFNLISHNTFVGNFGESHAALESGTSQTANNTQRVLEYNVFLNNFTGFPGVMGQEGGAVSLAVFDSSSWDIHDNLFQSNSAGSTASPRQGGAIVFQNGRYWLHRNSFINNFGCSGSAITARQNLLLIADSNEFVENSGDIAVYAWLGAVVHATNCNFINNRAGLAMGVLSSGSTAMNCYWGDENGPRTSTMPFGGADSIGDSIAYTPWLTRPVIFPTTAIRGYRPPFVPTGEGLLSVAPNPFNLMTTITYDIPRQENVDIRIYDLTGRIHKKLFQGVSSAGIHRMTFDGSRYATGTYFVRIRAGNQMQVKKVVLLK